MIIYEAQYEAEYEAESIILRMMGVKKYEKNATATGGPARRGLR